MTEAAYTCPECELEYNAGDRLPLILPECGHTLCKRCAHERLETGQCPQCSTPLGRPVAQLKPNLLIQQAVEALHTPLNELLRNLTLDSAASSAFIDPDRVRLSERIGAGGGGEVWRGTFCGRQVAVKLVAVSLPPSSAPSDSGSAAANCPALQSFVREVSVLLSTAVDCMYVVKALGCTVKNGQPGIVMKLYARGDLSHHIPPNGLPLEEALRYGSGIAKSLAEVHSLGIIMADLKPQNVLLSDLGDPVLTDFGISRIVNQTLGAYTTMHMAGTPQFMAPEQLDCGVVTSKVDAWAWGCTMVHMLTGQVPWAGLNLPQIFSQVVSRQHTPDIPASAPKWLQQLLGSCFARDHRDRPTAHHLVEALQAKQFRSAGSLHSGSAPQSGRNPGSGGGSLQAPDREPPPRASSADKAEHGAGAAAAMEKGDAAAAVETEAPAGLCRHPRSLPPQQVSPLAASAIVQRSSLSAHAILVHDTDAAPGPSPPGAAPCTASSLPPAPFAKAAGATVLGDLQEGDESGEQCIVADVTDSPFGHCIGSASDSISSQDFVAFGGDDYTSHLWWRADAAPGGTTAASGGSHGSGGGAAASTTGDGTLVFCDALARVGDAPPHSGNPGSLACNEVCGRPLGHLQDLNLSDNQIGAEGARALAGAAWPQLSALHLRGCALGDEGAAALGAAADAAFPRLQVLGLGLNGISDKGGRRLFSDAGAWPWLAMLQLQGNRVGDEGAAAFAASGVGMPLLEAVNLSGNALTERGVQAVVAAAVQHWPRMKRLALRRNPGAAAAERAAAGALDIAAALDL